MFINRKTTCLLQKRRPVNALPGRRGFSLVVVMVAISMSLVLTYSFLRTQATAQQILQNGSRSDLALQAAHTGASIAVAHVQTTAWKGVEETLKRTVLKDASGTASYLVEFVPLDGSTKDNIPDDAALQMVVRSTGTWTSSEDSRLQLERTVEVVLRLKPRLPGREIRIGDDANVSDVAANAYDYDEIQKYALFAGDGYKSLVLDPRDRIDGPMWVYDNLVLFQDPTWSGKIRDQVLEDIGQQFVSSDGKQAIYQHPHPLAGSITFRKNPSGSVRDDLEALGISWDRTHSEPKLPRIERSDWSSYRLYEKGFEYKPVKVDSYLRNETLRPSADNPLGIFYHDGSMTIGDNVAVQGTLLVDGTLKIEGEPVQLTAFNWRGDSGREIVSDQELWPRLPAIVAHDVYFSRATRAIIEGAVIADGTVEGAGGAFEFAYSNLNEYHATAVASPAQQPWSVVDVQGDVNLSTLNKYGKYSIWIPEGSTGNWYEISKVDLDNNQLTVLGEVATSGRVDVRIRANRQNYVDIRGPVTAETVNINRTDPWGEVAGWQWNELYDGWENAIEQWEEAQEAAKKNNGNGRSRGRSGNTGNDSGTAEIPHPGSFIDWIADTSHFEYFTSYYRTYGLTFEPTFHLRHENMASYRFRWSPPLFRPYEGKTQDDEHAGYRWTVISWREVRRTNE